MALNVTVFPCATPEGPLKLAVTVEETLKLTQLVPEEGLEYIQAFEG